MYRRNIVKGGLLAGVGTFKLGDLAAQTATYPSKPVRLVVSYPPGGTTDIFARLIAQKISENNRGASFLVDNRPGGISAIGTAFVAKAPPDGYTLLVNETTYSILPSLFKSLPWEHPSDFVPVTMIMSMPFVMLVSAESKFRSPSELISFAKANPEKVTYGSGGVGASGHLSTVLFENLAGIKLTHVPYKGGGEALGALLSGQIDFYFDVPPTALGQIKASKARALAVASTQRIAALPDVPTFQESGYPQAQYSIWFGLVAPKNTPATTIQWLHAQFKSAINSPEILARIREVGGEPSASTPEEFGRFMAAQTQSWRTTAQGLGIVPQ